MKIPSKRESRKIKKPVVPPFSLSEERGIIYVTTDYLRSRGVPIRNRSGLVPIKYVSLDEFVIVDGKEDKSHST